ncbi:hypothetical protein NKH77_50805 [Streptomyces sp. M19]
MIGACPCDPVEPAPQQADRDTSHFMTTTAHTHSILRTPGIPSLLLTTLCCFSGFALLLPVTPIWALRGGADEFGSGLVTAVLMLTTVFAQLVFNSVLGRLGWSRTVALGVLLLGLPALFQAWDDALWLILLTTAVRGRASASSPSAAPPRRPCWRRPVGGARRSGCTG